MHLASTGNMGFTTTVNSSVIATRHCVKPVRSWKEDYLWFNLKYSSQAAGQTDEFPVCRRVVYRVDDSLVGDKCVPAVSVAAAAALPAATKDPFSTATDFYVVMPQLEDISNSTFANSTFVCSAETDSPAAYGAFQS